MNKFVFNIDDLSPEARAGLVRLATDPAIDELVAYLRHDIAMQWMEANDAPLREELWLHHGALERLISGLQSAAAYIELEGRADGR